MSRPDFSAKKKVTSAKARKNAYQNKAKERLSFSGGSFKRGFYALLRAGMVCFLVLCLSLVLLAGYRWLTTSPYFAVHDIQIKGNEHLAAQRIKKMAEVRQGQNCLALNMGKLKTRLLQEDWIKNVLVRRVLPDKLLIRVTEHQPAYWLQKKESLYYADSQGEIIAPVLPEDFISLPLLRIEKNQDRQLQGLGLIHEWTVQKKLPFSMAEVAWLNFLTEDILEFYLRDRSIALRLGSKRLEKNLQYLNQVWNELAERDELDEVDRILVYEEKAWVRMTKA